MKGHIYIVKAEGFERYKIGVSKHGGGTRKKHLQIGSPVALIEVASVHVEDCYGLEKLWHERLTARNVHGEWFELSQDEVDEIVDHLKMHEIAEDKNGWAEDIMPLAQRSEQEARAYEKVLDEINRIAELGMWWNRKYPDESSLSKW